MKKNFKHGALFACMTTLCASAALSFAFATGSITGVDAETPAPTNVFEMGYGASVKISGDGLRFRARMSQDYYDRLVTNDANDTVQLYGYIAPVEEFDKVEEYKDLGVKVGGKLDESKIYVEDGYYCANIVITNLNQYDLIDRSFSSIVYIYDGTTSEYIYADLAKDEDSHYNIEAQNRTQYQIVNKVMLAEIEKYPKELLTTYDWYGTTDYPIVIESVAEYNTFLAKAADEEVAELLSTRHVVLKKEVTVSVTDAAAEVAKHVDTVVGDNRHVVTFYDGNKIVARRFVADGGDAELPADPTRDGYAFKGWMGKTTSITADTDVYAKWGPSKGDEISFADNTMTSYGVILPSGNSITSGSAADAVIGQKVILSSGTYANGAHPAGSNYATTDGDGNAKDPVVGTVDQAYLAYDGNYGFNDYFVADFTGKNMPSIAFFANNYNNSMYYENGGKSGVVVLTGVTKANGDLYVLTEKEGGDRMDMFNGKGLVVCGPEMAGHINSVGVNGTLDFNSSQSSKSNKDVALGRANLDNNTQYRVIMGMQKNGNAIVVVYRLYNLDTGELVEEFSAQTWNYFSTSSLPNGQTIDAYAQGSIVIYGHFGTPITLDKTYPIYENTTLDGAWAQSCGDSFNNRVTFDGDSVVLGAGLLGSPTDGYIGPSLNDNGDQAYYAFDGEYGLGDYVAFDFTGQNMPEVAFFAKNYDGYMYAEDYTKQGIVVASGIMKWDGSEYSTIGSNCTKVSVAGPFMGYFASAAEGKGGYMMSEFTSALARANLVADTHYRVIMGFSQATDSRAITLHIYLYDLDEGVVLENSTNTSWNFFSGSNMSVGNMTTADLVGSIVLYGKFANITTTIDKLHGVFEDTTVADIVAELGLNKKTVIFQNYDGTELSTQDAYGDEMPEYIGNTPYKPANAIFESYTFIGWDEGVTAETGEVIYTALFEGNKRDGVNISASPDVTLDGDKVVLGAGSIGNGANYLVGQNYAEGATVTQSYIAFDGEYGIGDYIALDFTGKNMPEVMFFAKNYDTTMYYSEGKQGVVIASGVTAYNGSLSNALSNCTQVGVSGPFGAYMAGAAATYGGNLSSNVSATLARANLVDGTRYRIVIGFASSTNKLVLKYRLWNLDTNTQVEDMSKDGYALFTGDDERVDGMALDDLVGSIVLYGKFGTTCTIDKLWGVFEDTDRKAPTTGLNAGTECTVTFADEDGTVLQEETLSYGSYPEYKGAEISKPSDAVYDYVAGWDKPLSIVTGDVTYTVQFTAIAKEGLTASNVTANDDQIVLGAGSISSGCNYTIGQNSGGGTIAQAYLGLDGEYAFGDYLMLDFTGKNMPEVMFFAKDYNSTMYYEGTAKRGIMVASGITLWDGSIGSAQSNNTKVGVSGPYGACFVTAAEGTGGGMMSEFTSALARANLADGTRYRVIMGFEQATDSRAFTLNICLYNLDTHKVVESVSKTSWNFFSGSKAEVGNMTTADLVGSIVLYGKFGTTCTIDKLYGIFEDASFDELVSTYAEEASESTVPDYSKYTDTFDFYGYSSYSDGTYVVDGETYYVGKDLGTLKQYGLYGSAGMTIYFPQIKFAINDDPQSIVKAKALIDDLKKAGIKKTILHDSRISTLSMSETAIVGSGCQFATEADLDTYIYNILKDYATYEGVYGVMLGDEPKYSMLSAYAAVYNSLKRVKAANGWDLFIQYNLNPLNVTEYVYTNYYPATSGTYAWDNYRYSLGLRDRFTDTMTRYQQYIKDFLDAMQPDHIMYDDYPLHTNADGENQISNSYIPCLQFVAKEASDRGIKFYHITQSYENNVDGSLHRRYVTEKGAKWLNNMLLGFGVKQIAYYTYNTKSGGNSSGGESYMDGSSFVDYNGNPTSLYYTMQGIMANNQKFASTILQFDYKGSCVYTGSSTSVNNYHLSEITTSNSFEKLSAFSVNKEYALVTELYDDENDNYMYMAMNVVDPDAGSGYTETLTLTFNDYTKALVYRDGAFETVELLNGVLTVTADPGEAVYVIPYN